MRLPLSDRLLRHESLWRAVQTPPPPLPPGLYTMRLLDAVFHEARGGGSLSVKRRHAVAGGEGAMREVTDYLGFGTAYGVRMMREWLAKLHFTPPEDIRQMEDIIGRIAEQRPLVEMRARRGENGWLYLDIARRLDEGM